MTEQLNNNKLILLILFLWLLKVILLLLKHKSRYGGWWGLIFMKIRIFVLSVGIIIVLQTNVEKVIGACGLIING